MSKACVSIDRYVDAINRRVSAFGFHFKRCDYENTNKMGRNSTTLYVLWRKNFNRWANPFTKWWSLLKPEYKRAVARGPKQTL